MNAPASRRYLGEVVCRRYLIDRLVGEGSFAWVYHAKARSSEEVAVKVLHSTQATATVRFAREVKVLKALPENRYVAQYVDHGETRDSRPLLVLEFVDGITLKQGLERRPLLAPDKAVAFVAELCQAFVGLHQLGVAHRDVKPENILLARAGGIKLIDFGLIRDAQGILKLLEEEDQITSGVFSEDLDRGVLAGTPEYMAPEQFSDSAVEDDADTRTDTSSDVFSLGVILFELLAGRKLFPMREVPGRDYPKELLRYLRWRIGLRDEDVPELTGIDTALRSVVRKALLRDPKRRQPDARALMEDLLRYLGTGQGVTDGDESGTMVVSVDSFMAMSRAVARGTEATARAAAPALEPISPLDPEEETTTGTKPLRKPPRGDVEPAGRGHGAPFFEGREGIDTPAGSLPEVTVRLVPGSRREMATPHDEDSPPRPSLASALRQDVVPTQMLENDEVWPIENLADPPRKGEVEVPWAPTDVPSLGDEDLFDLVEDDAPDGFEVLGEDEDGPGLVFETDTREVDLAALMPDEVRRRDPEDV